MSTESASLAALIARLRAGADPAAPRPVEEWDPPDCGAIDIVICKDGRWVHEGGVIDREPLVRLFASLLRREADGRYFLVTPVEKLEITVEDAPFLGVRVDRDGEGANQTVVVTTNVGDVVTLGPQHPLRVAVDPQTGAPRPYALVRGRLEALITRAAFYEMAAWASPREGGGWGLVSGGAVFALGPETWA